MSALRDALGRCLDGDHADVHRLRHADTSVRFRVDGDDDVVTVHLDRTPPSVAPNGAPAEIQIALAPADAEAFMCGALAMPAAVVAGQVRAEGPVRKYLQIDPILRRLLASSHGDDMRPAAVAGSGAPHADLLAIQTRGLCKRFGSHEVLRGVDLAIPEGVISVVLGPSGTGKSVLLKHVIGLLKPDAGDVLVRGRPLSRMSRREILALRTEIGVMFQDGALFSANDVFDNVAFPLRQHTDLTEREIREVVLARLAEVGLAGVADRMPAQLSGGMKKRAGLARALVLDPGIVLCDEPDSGLDPVRTALLGDLLVDQHSRGGGTMVVITHNVPLARRVSDHISVLWQGEVLEAGMAAEILDSPTEFVQQFLAGATSGPLGMDA